MKAFMYIFLFISFTPGYFFPQEQISQLKYLSHNSDIILTGKVIFIKSAWADNKTRIITNVTVSADEYLKGSSGSELTIICPGGEVDDIGELYTHMPVFFINEEVLLFLRKGKDNFTFTVSGGETGKISISGEPGSDDKITSTAAKLSVLKKEIRNILENGQ